MSFSHSGIMLHQTRAVLEQCQHMSTSMHLFDRSLPLHYTHTDSNCIANQGKNTIPKFLNFIQIFCLWLFLKYFVCVVIIFPVLEYLLWLLLFPCSCDSDWIFGVVVLWLLLLPHFLRHSQSTQYTTVWHWSCLFTNVVHVQRIDSKRTTLRHYQCLSVWQRDRHAVHVLLRRTRAGLSHLVG